jgi:hypothetical protein
MIDVNSTIEVQNKLNEVASRLLNDKVYGDSSGDIGYYDLSFWLPTLHKRLLVANYDEKVAPFVEHVFAGVDVHQEAFEIVYTKDSQVPVLQVQRFDIDENATGGSDVGSVEVLSEGTSPIVLFELKGSGSENFVIDNEGNITLALDAVLDYETKTYYELYVTAFNDEGRSADTKMIVQLHNIADAPELTSYQATPFYADSPVDTEVFRFTFNSGSSALKNATLGGVGNIYFKTQIVGNDVVVKIAKPLPVYTTKRGYELTLQVNNATDKSSVIPFSLVVGDRRDIPTIQGGTFTLDENATGGTVVGKVNVLSDGDRAITGFELYGHVGWKNLINKFTIDSKGVIRVAANASLDYESQRYFNGYVRAVNSVGKSREVHVYISLRNIPDTLPTCQTTTLELGPISKAMNIGTSVVKNGDSGCYTQDSAFVSTMLEPTSPFEAVIATNKNGFKMIDIRLKDSLQDMNLSEYNLSLSVTNATGQSNKRPIHISIDDNNYVFEMQEGDLNKALGTIDVNSTNIYTIYSDNGHFSLDKNGIFRRNDRIENSFTPQYHFSITLVDKAYQYKKIAVVVNVKSRKTVALDTPGVLKKVVMNKANTRAYLADYDKGLHIVDISDINNPYIVASLDTNGAANDLVLSKDERYIYLLDVGQGLKVIDISNEKNPVLVSSVGIGSYSYNIVLSPDGKYAYISHREYGIEVVNVSNPLLPKIVKNIGFMGDYRIDPNYGGLAKSMFLDVDVSSDGKTLYIADGAYNLQVVDITDIANPKLLFSDNPSGFDWDKRVTVDKNSGIVLISHIAISDIYDTSDLLNIHKISHEYYYAIDHIQNNLAYVGNRFTVYDYYNPLRPKKLFAINEYASDFVVSKDGMLALLVQGQNGLKFLNLNNLNQQHHTEPVLLDTKIRVLESNLSNISIGDSLGTVSIHASGSPISNIILEPYQDNHGNIICDNEHYNNGCANYEEYVYFDIDNNGIISINDSVSLDYNSIGNQVVFGAYGENVNGDIGVQAKVTINIEEDPLWTLQYQRNVIAINDNINVGTKIANVMLKKSRRKLFSIGAYIPDENYCYDGGIQELFNYGISYNSALANYCQKSKYFDVGTNGDLTIIGTPPSGIYKVNIIAVDRYGIRFLNNQIIEVIKP